MLDDDPHLRTWSELKIFYGLTDFCIDSKQLYYTNCINFPTLSVIPLSPVECFFVCFTICNTCVKVTKVRFTMVAHGVNTRYSVREAVDLVLNKGSDLEEFSDSGLEENTVDSGKEFVSVDLEAGSSDSDNDIFILITVTSRIKNPLTVFG